MAGRSCASWEWWWTRATRVCTYYRGGSSSRDEVSTTVISRRPCTARPHQQNYKKLVTFRHFSSLLGCSTSAQGCTSCKVPESGQVIIWEYNNKVYFGYIVQTTN